MQMVSIPDGLQPWEDRSDICKLTLSILQIMSGKLEVTINKKDGDKVTCVIADACMGWAIRVAKNMEIRRAAFWPALVTTLASMLFFQKLIDDGIINNSAINIYQLVRKTCRPIKPEPDAATIEAAFQVVIEAEEASRVTDWFICNSTTELEFAPFSLYPKLLPILARRLPRAWHWLRIITREEITSKIEHLLSEQTIRDKALDIKDKIRSSVNEGACSQRNLNNFIEWLTEKDTNAKDQHSP
ncbi:hypothetical protein Tco_0824214 [Tanacetum coccineum]|uniref:Uncharacterized protein n=1 Tax=Tanacetum coccineum TaxID=301880 RepID=A0ABQ5AK72_9ASTR